MRSSCFMILRIHFITTRKIQEIAFQGFQISKFSRGSMPPDPPTWLAPSARDCPPQLQCPGAATDKNYDQGTFLTTVTSAGKHIMSFVTSRQTAMTSSTSYPDSLGKDPGLRDCGKFYLIGDCYAS